VSPKILVGALFFQDVNVKMNKTSDWLFFIVAIAAGFILMRWFFG
jgi:hypothetical protein